MRAALLWIYNIFTGGFYHWNTANTDYVVELVNRAKTLSTTHRTLLIQFAYGSNLLADSLLGPTKGRSRIIKISHRRVSHEQFRALHRLNIWTFAALFGYQNSMLREQVYYACEDLVGITDCEKGIVEQIQRMEKLDVTVISPLLFSEVSRILNYSNDGVAPWIAITAPFTVAYTGAVKSYREAMSRRQAQSDGISASAFTTPKSDPDVPSGSATSGGFADVPYAEALPARKVAASQIKFNIELLSGGLDKECSDRLAFAAIEIVEKMLSQPAFHFAPSRMTSAAFLGAYKVALSQLAFTFFCRDEAARISMAALVTKLTDGNQVDTSGLWVEFERCLRSKADSEDIRTPTAEIAARRILEFLGGRTEATALGVLCFVAASDAAFADLRPEFQ